MDLIKVLEGKQLKTNLPEFKAGDTLRIKIKFTEKDGKVRYQYFEGLCIGRKNSGLKETFTLRKISSGIGVERTFPLHSPQVEEIEIKKQGKVRRAKLYYIREKVGKQAKIKEKNLYLEAAKAAAKEAAKPAAAESEKKAPRAKKKAEKAE